MVRAVPLWSMAIIGCGWLAAMGGCADDQPDAHAGGLAGASAGEPSTLSMRPICDGQDGVVFGWFTRSGGLAASGEAMLWENGTQYLYVDGHCRYWVSLFEQHDTSATRTGSLTQTEASMLREGVRYADLAALSRVDTVACRENACGDCGATYLSDGDNAVRFEAGCGAEPLFEAATTLAIKLFERGAPLAGPVRAKAWKVVSTISTGPASAPPASPIDGTLLEQLLAYDGRFPASEGMLVDDPAVVASLRELRAGYEPGRFGVYGGGTGIPVRATHQGEQRLVLLAFRDVLPFEHEGGGFRLPMPSAVTTMF